MSIIRSLLNRLKVSEPEKSVPSVSPDKTEDTPKAKKKKKRSKKKIPSVVKVSEITGWTYNEALKEMKTVRSQLGVPFKVYLNKEYYLYSRSRQERKAGQYHRKKELNAKQYSHIEEKTGMTKKQVNAEIKRLRALKIYPMSFKLYFQYGMYMLTEDEKIALLSDLAKMKELKVPLMDKLQELDEKKISFSDVENDVWEYTEVVKKTLTPAVKGKILSFIRRGVPEWSEYFSEEDLITDMEVTRLLLKFGYDDYMMYHLYRFGLEEKLTFISDYFREHTLSKINCRALLDLVNNKYDLYKALPQYFLRDFTAIYSKNDFEAFRKFITAHKEFVIKPFNESMGRGISLIKIPEDADLEEEFDQLLKKYRTFLMEERIIQDDRMAAFNPDSLNTVRLMVFYDGEKAVPVTGFMRTGRVGSFVDNAGAGGVFASVDCETGILESVGGDERGFLYDAHPESGLTYLGFRIPNWEGALQVGCDAIKALGFVPAFIGWDLALNKEGKWDIVEGNGFPQFVNQINLGYGLKDRLMKIIGDTINK